MTGQHVDRLCHISGMKLVYYKKYRLGVIVMNDYTGLSLNDLYAFCTHIYDKYVVGEYFVVIWIIDRFCIFIEIDFKKEGF